VSWQSLNLRIGPLALRRDLGSAHQSPGQIARRFLAESGVEIHRLRPVRVVTSARTDGRAERGLAQDLALGTWVARRSYRGKRLPAESAARGQAAPRSP